MDAQEIKQRYYLCWLRELWLSQRVYALGSEFDADALSSGCSWQWAIRRSPHSPRFLARLILGPEARSRDVTYLAGKIISWENWQEKGYVEWQ
jgi:hypothetical protein